MTSSDTNSSGMMGGGGGRICGEYIDQQGRSWFCVQGYHQDRPDMVVCEGINGNLYSTACDTRVFAAWGWKPCESEPRPSTPDRSIP